MTVNQRRRLDVQLNEVEAKILTAQREDAVIVYLDEVMFTWRSVNKREFSNLHDNITMDMKRMQI